MNTLFLTRPAWGADPALPRLGAPVNPDERTEVYIHHTVAVDSDATPNVWETLDEVKSWMQRLQTVRPDLGLDVPYSFVVFFMPDQLVICEGRGWARQGAHTAGHNRTAIAFGVHGNFQIPTFGLPLWLAPLGEWIALESTMLPNLGTVKPPDRDVWGHRDSGALTSCPGDHLYANLQHVRLVAPEVDDMASTIILRVAPGQQGAGKKAVYDPARGRATPTSAGHIQAIEEVSGKSDDIGIINIDVTRASFDALGGSG